MDIEKYIKMSDEELQALDRLIPLDDVIDYKENKYKLDTYTKNNFIDLRKNYDYTFEFDDPINDKQKLMLINKITICYFLTIKSSIENAKKHNKIGRYKKIE